jgi:transcriptional regulator with XRE-family HTH domain
MIKLVAAILRDFRARTGVSQEAFALAAGVDRTYIAKLERRILNPTIARVERVLAVMGWSWVEFGAALDDVPVTVSYGIKVTRPVLPAGGEWPKRTPWSVRYAISRSRARKSRLIH